MKFKVYSGPKGDTEAQVILSYMEWQGIACEYFAHEHRQLRLTRGSPRPTVVLNDNEDECFVGFFALQEFLDSEGLRKL